MLFFTDFKTFSNAYAQYSFNISRKKFLTVLIYDTDKTEKLDRNKIIQPNQNAAKQEYVIIASITSQITTRKVSLKRPTPGFLSIYIM